MIKNYIKSKATSTRRRVGLCPTRCLVFVLILIGINISAFAQVEILQEVTFQPDEIKTAVET